MSLLRRVCDSVLFSSPYFLRKCSFIPESGQVSVAATVISSTAFVSRGMSYFFISAASFSRWAAVALRSRSASRTSLRWGTVSTMRLARRRSSKHASFFLSVVVRASSTGVGRANFLRLADRDNWADIVPALAASTRPPRSPTLSPLDVLSTTHSSSLPSLPTAFYDCHA